MSGTLSHTCTGCGDIGAEEWAPVVGAEGRYEVSTHGRVRPWLPCRGEPVPRLISQKPGSAGHPHVLIYIESTRRRTVSVHSLMLAALVGPRPTGMEVRHLDGHPTHNHLPNLAYGTRSENVLDRVRHGSHANAAKTECPRGHPYNEENTRYYVSPTRRFRVCRTCKRERDRAHGHHDQCRGEVRCPATWEVIPCDCCGER